MAGSRPDNEEATNGLEHESAWGTQPGDWLEIGPDRVPFDHVPLEVGDVEQLQSVDAVMDSLAFAGQELFCEIEPE
jgi:hypothetical protein